MAVRYVAARRVRAAYWDDDLGAVVSTPDSITVIESDRAPVDTGLLDASGVTVFRVTDREPVGIRPASARAGASHALDDNAGIPTGAA